MRLTVPFRSWSESRSTRKNWSRGYDRRFQGPRSRCARLGPQIILDGQVPDSKTMADVIQLVTITFMASSIGGAAAAERPAAARWVAAGRRAAERRAAAAAMGGGGGDGRRRSDGRRRYGSGRSGRRRGSRDCHHQSRHDPRASTDLAPCQNRRDQSKRDQGHRRELAVRAGKIDSSARRSAITRRSPRLPTRATIPSRDPAL